MSEAKDDPTKPGDASHILDNVPPPERREDKIGVPVSVAPINDHGEHIKDAAGNEIKQPVGKMKSSVVQIVSGMDVVNEVKAAAEPCTACVFGRFPEPGSQAYGRLLATIRFKINGLPDFMRETVQGRDPAEWLRCFGWPERFEDNGAMHFVHIAGNTCGRFNRRKGTDVPDDVRAAIAALNGRG